METAMNYLPKHVARRKVKNGEKSPWGQCLTRPALLAVLSFSSFHIYFSARLDFPSPPLSLPGSPRMSKGGMIVSYMPKGQWLILCCCPIIGRGITNFLQILAILLSMQWVMSNPVGSFENEALENEDRSTKHPKLENEAPKNSTPVCPL